MSVHGADVIPVSHVRFDEAVQMEASDWLGFEAASADGRYDAGLNVEHFELTR